MKSFFALLSLLCLSIMGCGITNPKSAGVPLSSEDPKALARADMQGLSSLDRSSLQRFDLRSHQRFSQIFGGNTGEDVTRFINERVRTFLKESEVLSIQPRQFRYTGWVNNPERHRNAGNSVMGAANLGAAYTYHHWLDGVPVSLMTSSFETIQIESTRSGIMLFGPGYASQLRRRNGQIAQLSPGFRQAILVHEARHSDCTGGMSQSTLRALRDATTYREGFENTPTNRCGHYHAICPTGDLAGLEACDAYAWGAYSIGVLYSEAMMENLSPGSAEWQVLNASVIEQKTRILVNYAEMIRGQFGNPDISHSDAISN